MVKLVVHWCHDDTLLSSSGVDHEDNSDGNGSANDGDKNDNAKLCNPHHQVGVILLSLLAKYNRKKTPEKTFLPQLTLGISPRKKIPKDWQRRQ